MNRKLFAAAVLTTLAALPLRADTFAVDPNHSEVSFHIRHMVSQVRGRFNDFSGTVQLDPKNLPASSVEFHIKASSIDTGVADRDKHLRSADFFDVERFPEISVVVTAVHPTRGNAADLRASFSIKGETAPLPLPVTITELDDGSIQISGEAKVDRSEFGLGWNKFGMIGATATAAAQAVFVRAPR